MDSERITLLIAYAIATHLIRICLRTPNVPSTKHGQDLLFSVPIVKEHGAKLLEYAFVAPCIYHIFLTAYPPQESSATCPQPNHLDPKYFTWSPHVTICVVVIYILATLRLLAYRTLGQNFTFELAKPDQLVTTGVYSYVQHPSYGPLFGIICSTLMLFLPLDAGAGCFLPSELVAFWISYKWQVLIFAGFIIAGAISVRVRDEEAMLKATFGKQWVEWHRRTPRFIPFLF